QKHIQRVLNEGKDDFETLHRTRQGEIRYIHVTAQSLQAGRETVYHCIWRDITDRRRAEEALRESEEKYRRIVESSPVAMYFYRLTSDDRLVLTGVNPSADRIVGIDHQRLLGKTMEEAFPSLANSELPTQYRQVARGELGPQSFEYHYNDERFSGYYVVPTF
ncbi:MAG: PAS domain S-box protein, partial [Deltaproteobacteria bacterium]|nr:PAS domain S-box protein [Deltaproteobacteria bacterium]